MPSSTLPPGPRGKPILGSLWDLVRRGQSPEYFREAAQKYGDLVHFKIPGSHLFFVNHPDLIQEILVSRNRNFLKIQSFGAAKSFLGKGLLRSEGDFHFRQRKWMQPAFHPERVASYGRVISDRAFRLGERWKAGEIVDLHRSATELTMDIAIECLLGLDPETGAPALVQELKEMIRLLPKALLPRAEILGKLPLPGNRCLKRAEEKFNAAIFRWICERRQKDAGGKSFLSSLLAAGEGEDRMSDLEIRDELMTLFLAGHETAANALTWTFYLLARHPEVERRFHEEIDEVLEARLPAPEDLERLPYTRMVLSESMRLYPPAWGIRRRAIADCELGGFLVPAGSILLMSQYVTHRDRRFYPNPDEFDPMRWLPETMRSRPKLSYFPFGAGPRSCIGEAFAWMEGMLALATLSSKWRMRLTSQTPVEIWPLFTLRPKTEVRMRLEIRKAGENSGR